MTDKSEHPYRASRKTRVILVATAIALLIGSLLFVVGAPLTRPVVEPLPTSTVAAAEPSYSEVDYAFGRGYIGAGWQVYFNEPNSDLARSDYADGIDIPLANAIADVQRSLDIAAFELNNETIFAAILDAHTRGVAVRIVTDNEHGLFDEENEHLRALGAAGVPIVDDGRGALMHNKFMILDRRAVWTGSWNYTVNGTFRNNNNAVVIENAVIVAGYQAEFEEMFELGNFGARSPDAGVVVARFGTPTATYGMTDISIIFAPETDEISRIAEAISAAEDSIHLMVFVFSLGELADVILEKMNDPNFVVRGVFENRNSKASWSQLPALHCAGADMRQDGNPYILHHKVLIIDDHTVITGSFNFSNNAAQSNDENIVIIRDPVIAGLYMDEWKRIWDSAEELEPDEVVCD